MTAIKLVSQYPWADRHPGPSQKATIETVLRLLNEDESGWLLSRYREELNAADEEGNGDEFPWCSNRTLHSKARSSSAQVNAEVAVLSEP